MPLTRTTPYKFFSLWFAWCFGLGIVAYLLIHTTGIFAALKYEFRRSPVLSELVGFVNKVLIFTPICWFAVYKTTQSYDLYYSDLLPVLKYYWILGIIFIVFSLIVALLSGLPVLIIINYLFVNIIETGILSLIFYIIMKRYAVEE